MYPEILMASTQQPHYSVLHSYHIVTVVKQLGSYGLQLSQQSVQLELHDIVTLKITVKTICNHVVVELQSLHWCINGWLLFQQQAML